VDLLNFKAFRNLLLIGVKFRGLKKRMLQSQHF